MFNKKIKELEKRIQDMSEIITDFETSVFKMNIGEDYSLVTNSINKTAPNSAAIEITVGETKNIMSNGVFDGKKIEFTLKHPRTYR